MSISLYDATVPSNLQILRAVSGLIDKAEAYAAEKGLEPASLINARLAEDMHPFAYQVKSCVVHSLYAIQSVGKGEFSPDQSNLPDSFDGLRAKVADGIAGLEALLPSDVDNLADADTSFSFGETRLPFSGANFLLSFSQPNFYFHAATAYDILRAQGVPLGKRDFMGMPRMKM